MCTQQARRLHLPRQIVLQLKNTHIAWYGTVLTAVVNKRMDSLDDMVGARFMFLFHSEQVEHIRC